MATLRSPALRLVVLALAAGCGGGPSYKAAAVQVRSTVCDEKTEAYFAGPWPDDRRLVDGVVRTLRFPRIRPTAFFQNILTSGDKVVHGWGLSSPIYVPLTGAIDPASLPGSPEESRGVEASVYLTAVDPESRAYGLHHPVDFRFFEQKTLYLGGNVLAVRPFPGFPLEAKTTYALVVTTRLKDANGAAVGPDEPLWNVLNGKSKDPALDKLLALVDAQGAPREKLAGAFTFTTQPTEDELLTLRDFLEAQPDPSLDALTLTATKPGFFLFEGTYQAPNLQHGTVPYELTGGGFEYDAAGAPLVGQVEAMRVALCVPKGPAPSGGFPVVLYSHGTGGNYKSGVGDICADLASLGIATVGIDQVFHGPRGNGATSCLTQDIELCFFNPVNVVSGRNTIRQAALDNVMLRKMLTKAVIPDTLHPEHERVTFFANRVGFFGHSQGGLTGAVYTAFEKHLAGAVLSGAGGHLTTTILVRTDPVDLRGLAAGPLMLGIEGQEALDAFHPALAFIQALADVADPASHARHWVKRPEGAPKHLYVTSGMLDPYTSPFTAEVLATAAGIPVLTPVAEESRPHAVAGLAPVSAPVVANVSSDDGRPVTAVLRQFPGQGHFPVFDDATARAQWKVFFNALLNNGTVTVVKP